jgi:hypothetical protein
MLFRDAVVVEVGVGKLPPLPVRASMYGCAAGWLCDEAGEDVG